MTRPVTPPTDEQQCEAVLDGLSEIVERVIDRGIFCMDGGAHVVSLTCGHTMYSASKQRIGDYVHCVVCNGQR